MVLKDSSPYNVQWRGARPTFVDVGSFEPLGEGEAWTGYRQFCMLYLYPLLLQAYKGVAPHAWLRGSLDGIPPEQMARLFAGGAEAQARRDDAHHDARPPRRSATATASATSSASCARPGSRASSSRPTCAR